MPFAASATFSLTFNEPYNFNNEVADLRQEKTLQN
jgi:hypothetical protein